MTLARAVRFVLVATGFFVVPAAGACGVEAGFAVAVLGAGVCVGAGGVAGLAPDCATRLAGATV